TVSVLAPAGAAGSIVIVTGMLVSLPPLEMPAVTPVPLTVSAATPLRFDPVIVANMVVPCTPDDGATDVIDGAGGIPLVTFRMRALSEIHRLPSRSIAMPLGDDNAANVAGPQSPLKPLLPLPATVLMTPAAFTMRTRL